MRQPKVIVVGAGVAGLNCARLLSERGCDVSLWEASDRVGGRLRTDIVDGFQLDHGFQVLQTGYPEAKRALNLDQLQLAAFEPGALIQTERGRARMVDPWRRPSAAVATMFNHVGTIGDRWRLARLREAAMNTDKPEPASQDVSVQQWLSKRFGFSNDFINRFLRPWISGMFFDESLESSAQFFQFIFRTLALGDAALPKHGIHAIAQQLASRLPESSIRFGNRIQRIDGDTVISDQGDHESADAIVLAVAGPQLQPLDPSSSPNVRMVGTAYLYFATSSSPNVGKSLVLNGELDPATGLSAGPISNLSVPSNVCPDYAPKGQSLICVSIRPSLVESWQEQEMQACVATQETAVREQATRWFGSEVDSWRLLRADVVPHAVPRLLPGHYRPDAESDTAPDHEVTSDQRDQHAHCNAQSQRVWHCGDYLESPSLQGALVSGRKAAEAVWHSVSSSA